MALAVFVLSGNASQAQDVNEIRRCRAIAEDARRLACYDAIDIPTASPLSKYEVVPLGELRAYALSYRGQLVETEGWLTPGESYLFLGDNADDPAPVPIDAGTLPRRVRETLLEQCGSGCEAVVQGRVRPVNFTTGIVADNIVSR